MENEKANRPQGLFYVVLNGAFFLGSWLWPATKGFVDWTFCYTWVESAATAGELTVLFAAVLALVFPRGFLWTFGRLIRLLIEFWQVITGRRPIEPSRPADVPSASPKALLAKKIVPPSAGALQAPDWQPWAVLLAVLILLFGSLPFRDDSKPGAAAQTSTPTVVPEVVGISDDAIHAGNDSAQRPSSLTITTELSCEEIAARFCRPDLWREFTSENSIRVKRKGKRYVCVIRRGKTYNLPKAWTDEHCKPLR